MMKRRLIWMIVWALGAVSAVNAQFKVSETKYDYAPVAQQITEGAATKMEQAKSIYRWLCNNIVYDTTYQIFTADECWDRKSGVCQAYCELFYRLGEPLGINTFIITGKTKDMQGNVSPKGHSWLMVEVEDGWILIDPTWGAGGINDSNEFQRKENDMSWFHIDPYWLIFSHYPDEERYQFLENPVSWEAFLRLPTLYPALGDFGWNGKDIFTQVQKGEIKTFPQFHETFAENLNLLDVPIQRTLRPGNLYDFCIQKKKDTAIVLIHNGEFVHESRWEQDGDVYRLRYMPVAGGTLKISIHESERMYSAAVTYQVAKPTKEELSLVEKHRPFRMPELKGIKFLDVDRFKAIGMDGAKLLAEHRQSKIQSVPILYKDAESFVSEADVPFREVLRIGQSYRFSFVPKGGQDWQIINGDDWYDHWSVDPITGRMTIHVTPKVKGRLKVSVQQKEGGSYSTMIGYRVLE